MDDQLVAVARQFAFTKIDRLEALDRMVKYNLAADVFRNCIRGEYAIMLFDAEMMQITPYGIQHARGIARTPNQIYLTMFPELSEKFLRQVFTSFELLVFKICHIFLEGMRSNYKWETEKTRDRFDRLQPLLVRPDWDAFKTLFGDIFFVRNAFAHSFVGIERELYTCVTLPREVCR